MDLCFDVENYMNDNCICIKCIDGYYVGSLDEWNIQNFWKCYQCNIQICKKCDTYHHYCDECMDGWIWS